MCFKELLSRFRGRIRSSSPEPTSNHSRSHPDPLAPRPVLLAPYSWDEGQTFTNEVRHADTFIWEEQDGERSHILATWPPPEHTLDVTWSPGPETIHEGEVYGRAAEILEESADTPCGPLRLYDCDNMILKDQRTYLEEMNGVVPPYLAVSQVWGDIKEFMTLPTVPWKVPISDERKWHAIQEYCGREQVRWLWMDILCINQSRSWDAEWEKEAEIPKMSYYYRDAIACLVIPQYYDTFSTAYSSVMEVLSLVVDTGALVENYAKLVWDTITDLYAVLEDPWFWRLWTYQELLLPKKHVLLDGGELSIEGLGRCLGWYYKMLRNGTLKKPRGGKEYSFLNLRHRVIDRPWTHLKNSWDLRPAVRQDGYLGFLPAVRVASMKNCRFPVDKMLGIYGLLREEDRLRTLHEPEAHLDNVATDSTRENKNAISDESLEALSAHLSPARQMARLEWLWEQSMVKAVTGGKVWPLLYDAMIVDAPKGTNWIPRMVTGTGFEVNEVWDQRNHRGVAVTEAGVHLTARVVGRISGVSASIGDGTGEANKFFACSWALVAKGYDPQPILELFDDALAHSDTVPQHVVQDAQTRLRRALHAPSLLDCFSAVEKVDLRRKLYHGRGIAGWDRAIFAAQPGPSFSGADGTYVFLGWIYREMTADPEQGWILDITAGSPNPGRWVIANKTGPNTFHKIGSVAANSVPVFSKSDVYRRVILD